MGYETIRHQKPLAGLHPVAMAISAKGRQAGKSHRIDDAEDVHQE